MWLHVSWENQTLLFWFKAEFKFLLSIWFGCKMHLGQGNIWRRILLDLKDNHKWNPTALHINSFSVQQWVFLEWGCHYWRYKFKNSSVLTICLRLLSSRTCEWWMTIFYCCYELWSFITSLKEGPKEALKHLFPNNYTIATALRLRYFQTIFCHMGPQNLFVNSPQVIISLTVRIQRLSIVYLFVLMINM